MSDGHLPDGTPEPTTAMPVTPGPAATPPPPGTPPPGAPPFGDDTGGSGQPPWVIPTVVGIVAVAVIILALILSRGDDSDDALPAVDTSTTTTVATDTTVEIVSETTPGSTAAETTIEATTTTTTESTTTTTVVDTTIPASTAAPTTVATGAVARPAADLGANAASLATVDDEQTFAVLGTCSSTPTVGLQAISSVLANESGTVYVVDVYFDEGSDPFIEVADMSQSIAGFIYGQDTPGDNFRWSADLPDPDVIDQMTLTALDGTTDPISLSLNSDAPTECGRGFVVSPSPFPEAGPIDFVEQFDPDVPGDGFALLAACDDDTTYVTSGGGLLSISTTDPGFAAEYFVDLPANSVFWTTPDGVTVDQQIVVQNGGGGDTDYATQVVNFDDDRVGYLSARVPPVVDGGLDSIDCPA